MAGKEKGNLVMIPKSVCSVALSQETEWSV